MEAGLTFTERHGLLTQGDEFLAGSLDVRGFGEGFRRGGEDQIAGLGNISGGGLGTGKIILKQSSGDLQISV